MANTPDDVFLNFSDFTGNVFTSRILKGLRYRLLRDKEMLLEEHCDYTTSPISFTITSFNIEKDTTIQMQFY